MAISTQKLPNDSECTLFHMECDHVSATEGEVHQIELFVVDHGFSVLVAVHKILEHEPFMYGIYWLYGTCMVYLYDIMLMGTKQHSGYCLLGSLFGLYFISRVVRLLSL